MPSRRYSVALLIIALTSGNSAFGQNSTESVPANPSATSWDQVIELVQSVWRFELFRIKDQPVHTNQFVIAVLILVAGLWLSSRISKLVTRRLIRLPGMKSNAAVVFEKLTFYALAVIVFMIALQTVNIPIATFAVLGGALAIGIGFGAQNLFNNFMSGVILLIERPIRIGDMIEVEENLGRVESVNARCTYIKRVDGVDLLVPNSKLLENNVVNWTRSDKEIRTSIIAGVIYGSPTDEVSQILEECVSNHPRVLSRKPINVIFDDFGDNSLVFETYFWTEVESQMELRVIRSEIRFEVDKRFRERGLVIAFPQRDIHIDSVRPIQVELSPTSKHSSTDN